MALHQIGKMSLKCSMFYVTARVQFAYLDAKGDKQVSAQSDEVRLGEVKAVDPGDLNVPDGSTVFMHVFVLPGTDNEASRGFIYQKGSPQVANYEIKGETIENDLVLIGISSEK